MCTVLYSSLFSVFVKRAPLITALRYIVTALTVEEPVIMVHCFLSKAQGVPVQTTPRDDNIQKGSAPRVADTARFARTMTMLIEKCTDDANKFMIYNNWRLDNAKRYVGKLIAQRCFLARELTFFVSLPMFLM